MITPTEFIEKNNLFGVVTDEHVHRLQNEAYCEALDDAAALIKSTNDAKAVRDLRANAMLGFRTLYPDD